MCAEIAYGHSCRASSRVIRLARPDHVAVNILGDVAFGLVLTPPVVPGDVAATGERIVFEGRKKINVNVFSLVVSAYLASR